MTTLDQIATRIIKEQELIIGPVAWSEAKKVDGLHVMSTGQNDVTIDEGGVIDRLIAQYERIFGRASREVCRDAAASLISGLSPSDVPVSLR